MPHTNKGYMRHQMFSHATYPILSTIELHKYTDPDISYEQQITNYSKNPGRYFENRAQLRVEKVYQAHETTPTENDTHPQHGRYLNIHKQLPIDTVYQAQGRKLTNHDSCWQTECYYDTYAQLTTDKIYSDPDLTHTANDWRPNPGR